MSASRQIVKKNFSYTLASQGPSKDVSTIGGPPGNVLFAIWSIALGIKALKSAS